MTKFLKNLKTRLNNLVWTLTSTGVMLLLLAALSVFGGDILGRLAIAIFVIAIAIIFFYLARFFWSVRAELEKLLKV